MDCFSNVPVWKEGACEEKKHWILEIEEIKTSVVAIFSHLYEFCAINNPGSKSRQSTNWKISQHFISIWIFLEKVETKCATENIRIIFKNLWEIKKYLQLTLIIWMATFETEIDHCDVN